MFDGDSSRKVRGRMMAPSRMRQKVLDASVASWRNRGVAQRRLIDTAVVQGVATASKVIAVREPAKQKCSIASFSSSVKLRRFDRRFTRHRGCQDSFNRWVLSSAANIAAYLRAGTGMKPRSPVNFHLATIDQISPAAQAELRDFRRRGVMRERHSAPVQRLHMHRPERLHSLVAFVRRQLERSSSALPSTLVALGFGKDFGILRTDFGRFRVRDGTQPACKCCAREVVNPAVAALRQAAALPRLDVNRPPLAPGFVLEMFWTHRRISTAAENPIWNDSALSESRARTGRLRKAGKQGEGNRGWQGKAPTSVVRMWLVGLDVGKGRQDHR